MLKLKTKLDWTRILKDKHELIKSIQARGVKDSQDLVESLIATRNSCINMEQSLNDLRHKRNENVAIDRTEMKERKNALDSEIAKLNELMIKLPNWTKPNTPEKDEFKVVKTSKLVLPTSNSKREFVEHSILTEDFNLVDFKAGVKTSGTKFAFLKNEAAVLELALQMFTIDRLRKKNFTPVATVDLLRPELIQACGFQPRGEYSQVYHIQNHDLALSGTSEIALAGYLSNSELKTTKENGGVFKYAGYGHCFRTEAGAHGKSDKGLYRLHQFTKVEMFVACLGSLSESIHEELIDFQLGMCDALGLQWRLLEMPTLELGNSAYSKYDVEVWMPGSKKWGEVASITNCIDFQSRRLGIMITDGEAGGKKQFAHTLNGTACAIPRVLASILETHYDGESRTIPIPEALRTISGIEKIIAN